MMRCLQVLLSVLAIATLAYARPQSNANPIEETIGQGLGIGATVFSSVMETGRAIGEQFRDLASSAWTSGTQALIGANNAFRESTVGALQGVRDGMDETGSFVSGSIRSGGRFAADAVRNSFQTARDATSSAGEFVAGVSRSAIQTSIDTAESAGNLAGNTVQNVGSLASSANRAVGDTVVGAIDNFSDPGRF